MAGTKIATLNEILVTRAKIKFPHRVNFDNITRNQIEEMSVWCIDNCKDLWREEHNIDIHGIPVEVYVEDVSKPAVSSTYSILKDSWIKQPKPTEGVGDVDRIERLCKAWMILITTRLATQDLEQIEQVKDMLWQYRKAGLAKEGETGAPNLVFKTLRNSGVTEMLLRSVSHLRDQALSLENLQ